MACGPGSFPSRLGRRLPRSGVRRQRAGPLQVGPLGTLSEDPRRFEGGARPPVIGTTLLEDRQSVPCRLYGETSDHTKIMGRQFHAPMPAVVNLGHASDTAGTPPSQRHAGTPFARWVAGSSLSRARAKSRSSMSDSITGLLSRASTGAFLLRHASVRLLPVVASRWR